MAIVEHRMKTYLIIGGSTGIGRQLALSLKAEGHQVYATYCNTPTSSEGNLAYHQLDVKAESLDFSFLPSQIDGLAYCPGSIDLKPFARIKPESFAADYELQVIGAIKVIQAVLPQLKKSENPAVVLFSTVAVQMGFTFHAQVSASKGAIEGLTRALAAEFAPKIRFNAIAPSITNTPLAARLLNNDKKMEANAERHPMKKVGEPTDIAAMAAFLLSDKASWTTGQIFHVDGGMSSIK